MKNLNIIEAQDFEAKLGTFEVFVLIVNCKEMLHMNDARLTDHPLTH